jgi:hypothetical protein
LHAASVTSSWAGYPTTWNGRARCMRGPRRFPRTTRCTPRWALSGQSAVHLTSKRPAAGGQAAIRFAGRIRFPGGEKREVERRRRFEETMRFGGEVEAGIPSDPWL